MAFLARKLGFGKKDKGMVELKDEDKQITEKEEKALVEKASTSKSANDFFALGEFYFKRYEQEKAGLEKKISELIAELKTQKGYEKFDSHALWLLMPDEKRKVINVETEKLEKLIDSALDAFKKAANQQHPEAAAFYVFFKYWHIVTDNRVLARNLFDYANISDLHTTNLRESSRDWIDVLIKALHKKHSFLAVEVYALITLGLPTDYLKAFQLLKDGIHLYDDPYYNYCMAALVSIARDVNYVTAAIATHKLFHPEFMPFYHLLQYPDVMAEMKGELGKKFSREKLQALKDGYAKVKEAQPLSLHGQKHVEGYIAIITKHLAKVPTSYAYVQQTMGVATPTPKPADAKAELPAVTGDVAAKDNDKLLEDSAFDNLTSDGTEPPKKRKWF